MSELTREQKKYLTYTHNNAKALSDPKGSWTDDLAAVVEAAEHMQWLLESAFPFLSEEVEDE